VTDFLGGALEATLRFVEAAVFFGVIVDSPCWWLLLWRRPLSLVSGGEIQFNQVGRR
jgi:hypothetical protein